MGNFSPPSNGNDQDDQKENNENYYNIFTTTLPSRPGYDVFSKETSRADEIKDIIIKSLVRNGISSDAYALGPTEQRDGRRIDILYLLLDKFKESLPPVIILNENNGKRQLKYAEDAVHVVRQFKHKCLPSMGECAVTPIESICEQQESEDLVFVKVKRRTNAGRFNWAYCYIKGRAEGLFQRYSSHTTLRKAFEREAL
ncbi:hypothetical protein G6F33_009112 [Rhizopus arrhizus]|nr:hypothetical protein G6F33_009112 [Rhizopus arrhizus]